MEQPTLSSATNPLIDALVLQHLQKRFPQSAECLQRELASRDAAAAAPPPTNRHALLMLLAPPGDETPLWATAYAEVRGWVDGALDTEGARYKPELSRLLWPLFAYTYLELLRAGAREQAGGFFASFHADHALMRRDELNQLSQVSSAEQVDASEFARRLLTSRYEVRLSAFSRALLLGFVAERRLQLTLRMLNERIKLALPETLAPSDGGGPAAVALEDDVHGGARLWRRPLGAGDLARPFSEPCQARCSGRSSTTRCSRTSSRSRWTGLRPPISRPAYPPTPRRREGLEGWIPWMEGKTWREGREGGRA